MQNILEDLITISLPLYNTLLSTQKQAQILEQDLNHLRIENIRLEKALKSLQNTLALRGQVDFNIK